MTRGRDHAVDELGRLERLGQVVECTRAHTARGSRGARVGREHDHRRRCAGLAKLVEQLRARDAGQVDVEQHDVPRRLARLELVEDGHAIGRGLEFDELVLELARDRRRDRGDHRLIVVDDQDLDRVRFGHTEELPPAGQPDDERWTIGLSTIHDPSVVRLAGQTAKIQSEATFTVRSLGVLVEQVDLDLTGDAGAVVEHGDLDTLWVGHIEAICRDFDLAVGETVANCIAYEVVEHAFDQSDIEPPCEIRLTLDADAHLAPDRVDFDHALDQTFDVVERAVWFDRRVFESSDVYEVCYQA